MILLSAVKWLVICVLCNLATAVVVVAILFVVGAFSPPISADGAVAEAKRRMEEDYMRTVFRAQYATECAAEDYPTTAFRPGQAFQVTCSILDDSLLLARTTFIFGRDGLAGHDDWALDGENGR